jgi:hypothetical protein
LPIAGPEHTEGEREKERKRTPNDEEDRSFCFHTPSSLFHLIE